MTPAPTRRDLLRLGAAGLVAAGLRPLRAEPEKTKPIPIGIQLYSVGGECAKDLPATLKTLGEMGYDGVEFAGYHGWDRKPADLRKLLDDCGLRCCGTHTGIDTLLGDRLQRTADLHRTLGNAFLIAPSLPGQYHGTREKWLETAKLFNDIAAKAKPLGMRVGYHNHGHEFKKFGDETGWDLFFAHTVPEVVMQLDTGNCMGGGGDPVAILKKFPGRATTVHLKESGGGGVVGEGSVKWKEILPLCSTSGGTQWYIVEFGGSPHGPIECARRCLANLRKMTA